MRVIIVSAEKAYAENLQQSMNDMAFECLVAENREKGIGLIEESKPEIVAIDHNPPDVDASAILNDIRLKFPANRVSVLIASPNIGIGLACQAVQMGICGLHARRLELADLLVAAEAFEKEQKTLREKEEQHSRLAMEYAKLKLAYEDLVRKT